MIDSELWMCILFLMDRRGFLGRGLGVLLAGTVSGKAISKIIKPPPTYYSVVSKDYTDEMREIQKFLRGDRVWVGKSADRCRGHFDGDKEGIILHSDENFSGPPKYGILFLEDNKPTTNSAWYPEEDIKLLSTNRDVGEYIIQKWFSERGARISV